MQDQHGITEEEFRAIMSSIPEPAPMFYRLYYNEQGHVLFYSMEDLPGNYIEIDAITYAESNYSVQVINGQIVPYTRIQVHKLTPHDAEGTPCHPDNVCIVVAPTEPNQRWRLNTHVYESN